MFGSTSNDDTTQADQGATDAPDAVAMTSETPSYLPTVPPSAPTTDDTSTVSAEDEVLDSLVAAQDEHAAVDDSSASTPAAVTPVDASDLLKLKAQALQQLTPLVGHLEQSAEDRFRTFMMMIQASDDKSLITSAYEAAQGIEDEKVRAQALLDVVNEINYFTQQEQSSEEK